MISEPHQANFETLKRAFADDNICLMECQDKKTKETVNVICAIVYDGKEYTMVPFAMMFNDNPYELLSPPDPDNESGFLE